MKKLIILIFSLLSLLLSSVWIKGFCQENNVVNIENTKIKKIIPDNSFVGVVWAHSVKYDRDIFPNPDVMESLAQALKNSNIDIIRYPGGVNATRYFWDVSNKDAFNAFYDYTKYRGFRYLVPEDYLDFPSFIKFCNKYGIKSTVQVNPHTYFDTKSMKILDIKKCERGVNNKKIDGTCEIDWQLVNKAADYAAAQVDWVKKNGYLDSVKYWEIGNEDYTFGNYISNYSGEEYGKVASIFIKKMTAVDPSIKIILTNYVQSTIPSLNEWSKKVLKFPDLIKLKDNVFAVSNHIYTPGKSSGNHSYEVFRDNIYNNPELNLNERLNLHKSILSSAGYENKKIFINEFNSGWMTNPYIHTWLGAIGDAKMILTCANNPSCGHMDFHEIIYNSTDDYGNYDNKGFGLLHFAKDPPQTFIRNIESYIIELLNKNLKGTIIKTTLGNDNLFAVSLVDNNILRIILLNTEKQNCINFNFSGFSNLQYIKNESLGINVPEKFTVMDTGEPSFSPSEIRVLNILNDAIKVDYKAGKYTANLPANTLTVLFFKTENK